ncbi:class I SAM-dependent methyltransferase [Moorena sp. SIO3A2]|uniref:class I SAM-dependent methyltransferase n=1 Tax=Moorena sp. SIO3A2 TaxID=2607841 RepID=UPI00257E9C7D|nr:class I SAM-dependent methyltransferase [Moorena sp. SIO3A2]
MVVFKDQGHQVIGLDATPAFVKMAQQVSGCEVWQQSFLNLKLPPKSFDGIFANASLIHIPRAAMVRVLKDLKRSLVSNGAIVMSMIRGDHEGYSAGLTHNHHIYEYKITLYLY